MWTVNPQLCRLEGRIGVLTPGAFGDAVISNIDPFADLAGFTQHETALTHVIQHGNVAVDRTNP